MRPMSEAVKDGSSVLARLRPDLAEYVPEKCWCHDVAGLWVVVRHPGLADDGFDLGWNLAGPFGNGGWPDDWFDGFIPLPKD
jgi:hypothetical protein